jgi:hypothetical protein
MNWKSGEEKYITVKGKKYIKLRYKLLRRLVLRSVRFLWIINIRWKWLRRFQYRVMKVSKVPWYYNFFVMPRELSISKSKNTERQPIVPEFDWRYRLYLD